MPSRVVHADCDFFSLGGHAPAAARLVARAREALGAPVDVHGPGPCRGSVRRVRRAT
ncbi:hypothetical protein ACFWA9_37795 [Kitasatospora sp. NPDC059973]|uniref:hypothetical protein n=1 Tax=Kitasatospora sp. NPDC059973 TaxID=3347020 RepID=UPI00368E607B